ncbi:MAG: dual specificity protein phosphatase family protein [Candidatus Margulisiibacteriota bacterium]
MKKIQKHIGIVFLLFFALSLNAIAFTAKEVAGTGPYPYNFHIIDDHVYAGGHPLNPKTKFNNSDEQVLSILNYLKSLGVLTVINLENTRHIQERYAKLLESAGMKQLHIPLSSSHVPNKKEWKEITAALQQPVYIHCMWGADRTGAVVGRYLVEKYNLASEEAYQAVISHGKYAGRLGGLKGNLFPKLKDFIWFGPQK